jgi:replicative DNA helicase
MGAIDFERGALGAVLVNSENWQLVAVLRLDDFLLDSHRRIFVRMRALAESSRPIEPITVVNELDCHGELQGVGDVGYVSSLVDGLPDRPLDSVKFYVDEVRRFAALRRIAHAADSIREQAANDPGATIAGLRIRLSEVERDAARHEAELGARITRIEDIPDPFACPSDDIGWIVQGLIPARGITIIAGEAGAGKTWLALDLARALTLGGNFLGRRTRLAQVLYLDKENPLSLVRDRLQTLFGGTSQLRPWGLWCPDEPPMIGDPRLLEFARKGPLLIIDSMIRFHRQTKILLRRCRWSWPLSES